MAENNDVQVNYTISNLVDFIPGKNFYDAIGLIFVHLKPETRKIVHQRMCLCEEFSMGNVG